MTSSIYLLPPLDRIRQLDKHTPDYLGILDKTAKASPAMSRRDPVTNKLLPADQEAVNLLIANVPPVPLVTGDRDLLGLAFYNLIDNALKFTGPENAVEVRAREDGHNR